MAQAGRPTAGYTAGRRARHVPRSPYIAGASIRNRGDSRAAAAASSFSAHAPIHHPGDRNDGRELDDRHRRHHEELPRESQVETALALGATPSQAIKRPMKRSLILALSPVIDNTKTVGLISLPGAMTGLIMGGASPLEAVRLQMVVMNMLIGAATFSSIVAAYLSWQYFFTKAMQVDSKVFLDE